ncbi:MAG: tRNA (N6-threonylcarbamoyladenosine(37)-N6)-methyltransferase TrmO [Paludibacteraceae bacterium]|nr:tRNA (N6-threonylcarbamoyladenosine(37)-N6)-methyltransferase TrmO [Paludibacteraceae bacterium]
MTLKVIAYARNGHTDKFGIPRQSREESPILTRIVFEPEFSMREALRGIEGYSHLWLLWGFSEVDSWSPTVRPPRLGGNKRMGVFATRSPFRPNPIGLSSVRLLKAYPRPLPEGKGVRWELLVSGADVLDGTPIYDIKPYLSFSDSHPDARNGFAEETKNYHLEVDWGMYSPDYLSKTDRQWTENGPKTDRQWVDEVEYILRQDPRPGYQNDPEREYKMDYAGWRVTFKVRENKVIVRKIEQIL